MDVIDFSKKETTYRTKSLENWFNSVKDYKVLSIREEEDVIGRYKRGDVKALDELIKGNQRFLFMAARNFSRNGDEIVDLISEGNLGLMDAIEKFDLTYGLKFISFAVFYVKRNMLQYLYDRGLVKHHINRDLVAYVKKLKEAWFNENEFDMPSYMIVDKVKEEFGREIRVDSFFDDIEVSFMDDVKTNDEKGSDYNPIDNLVSVENECVDMFEKSDAVETVKYLLDVVCQNEMERSIIINTFGLFGNNVVDERKLIKKYKITKNQYDYLRRKLIREMAMVARGKNVKRKNKSKFQEGMLYA